MTSRRVRDERGQLASIEFLPFGILIFVLGVLFFGQIWAVLDAKAASEAAAREATHAFVHGFDPTTAQAAAIAAANDSIQINGRDPGRATVASTGPLSLERCARVGFEVSYSVPIIRAPLLPAWGGGFTVRSEHSEIVDPYRDGLTGGGCA